MPALLVMQLTMLVSPCGHWPHGPAISASRRCAEAWCGAACADFFVGWLGATRGEVDKAESRVLPNIRDSLTESQSQSLCEVLQGWVGLKDAELKQVVLRLPTVLALSNENNVLPSLAALQARLGLSDAELNKVVQRRPSVLGCSSRVWCPA